VGRCIGHRGRAVWWGGVLVPMGWVWGQGYGVGRGYRGGAGVWVGIPVGYP
jgi:hypothetical protein